MMSFLLSAACVWEHFHGKEGGGKGEILKEVSTFSPGRQTHSEASLWGIRALKTLNPNFDFDNFLKLESCIFVDERWAWYLKGGFFSLEGVSEAGGNEGGLYVMFNVKSMVSRSSILLNFLSEGYMLTQKLITGIGGPAISYVSIFRVTERCSRTPKTKHKNLFEAIWNPQVPPFDPLLQENQSFYLFWLPYSPCCGYCRRLVL